MPDPESQPSPEALKLNAIVNAALKAAQEAFNTVLVANGVAALDDSYEIEAQLSFRQRVAEPKAGIDLTVPAGTTCFIHGCEKPATRYLTLVGERGDMAPFCDECEA